MKLYSYSDKILTFVEMKWTKAKFAAVGILIATILFYGFIRVNQSVGHAFWSPSSNMLATENAILRQQLILISPRVNDLEIQAGQLCDRSDELHILLHPGEITGDTLSHFTNAIESLTFQKFLPVSVTASSPP